MSKFTFTVKLKREIDDFKGMMLVTTNSVDTRFFWTKIFSNISGQDLT